MPRDGDDRRCYDADRRSGRSGYEYKSSRDRNRYDRDYEDDERGSRRHRSYPHDSDRDGDRRERSRSRSRSPSRSPSLSPTGNDGSNIKPVNPKMSGIQLKLVNPGVSASPKPSSVVSSSSVSSSSSSSVISTKPAAKLKVASIFQDDDDDEPEEMPPECRMRMKNVGRETPTSAGPNSFGKTKIGFCNVSHINEKKRGT